MSPTLPKTESALRDGIDNGLHHAAQLYVSKDLAVVANLAVGQSRPDVAMTPTTIVPWLSAGKPITAAALAILWESGSFNLDDPVAAHLPAFGVRGKEKITLRHLLTHTGGFRGVAMTATVSPWNHYVEQVNAARLESNWAVGLSAGYHVNSSWIVLGELIQHFSGQRADAFIRDRLFSPLGMRHSHAAIPPELYLAYGDQIALLPGTDPTLPPRTRPSFTNSAEGAATLLPGQSLRGPMRELGRFYEMMLDNGRGVLHPQTVAAMTARHRTGQFDQTFRHPLDWGLGFMVNSEFYTPHHAPYGFGPHASRRTFGHGGRQTTTGFCDPENRLVVALAFNGTPGEQAHNQRAEHVLRVLYEELGLAGEAAPERPPREPRP